MFNYYVYLEDYVNLYVEVMKSFKLFCVLAKRLVLVLKEENDAVGAPQIWQYYPLVPVRHFPKFFFRLVQKVGLIFENHYPYHMEH